MVDDHRAVSASGAPQNDSLYSQAIVSGDLVFVSGQGPTDPDTMERVEGDVEAQTERALSKKYIATADKTGP